jgi:hypothetical protein
MTNYLTTNSATSIYQTKSDMIRYLTISSSISFYQTKSDISNYVSTSGAQTINGIKTFSLLPECNINPSSQYQLVNKNYVDSLPIHQTVSGLINYLSIYQTKSDMINYVTISGNQSITGVITFNSIPRNANPSISQTQESQYIHKFYADGMYLKQPNVLTYLTISSAILNYQPISLMSN